MKTDLPRAVACRLAVTCVVALTIGSCRPRDPRSLQAEDFVGVRAAGHSLSAPSRPAAWRSFGPPSAQREALRLLSRSPVGDGAGARSITLVFNQPMVHLAAASREPLPIRISPAVRAVHRWPSGSTLKVELLDPLPPARTYRVTVPASLRALSGQRLGREISWTFNSRRPRVVRVRAWPSAPQRHGRLRPNDKLLLVADQKLEPRSIGAKVSLRLGNKQLAVRVHRATKDPRQVVITPASPLPLGVKVHLHVAAGWRGEEGPLAAVKPYTSSAMQVARAPRAEIDCNRLGRDMHPKLGHSGPALRRCWSVATRTPVLTLRFAEPVKRRELLRHLRISPPIAGLAKRLKPSWNLCRKKKQEVCARRYRLQDVSLRRHTRYTVVVTKGLGDVHGRRLAKTTTLRFDSQGLPPGLFLSRGQLGLRERWKPLQIKAVNTSSVRARIATYRGAALARLSRCLEQLGAAKCAKQIGPSARSQRSIDTRGGRDRVVTRQLKPLPPGANIIRFDSAEVVDGDGARVAYTRLSLASAIGLHARVSPYGAWIWVTSLERARPLGTAIKLSLYSETGTLLWSGAPGADGTVMVDPEVLARAARITRARAASRRSRRRRAPRVVIGHVGGGARYVRTRRRPRLVLVARDGAATSAKDIAYLPLGSDPFATRPATGSLEPASLPNDWDEQQIHTLGHISCERGIYRPGQQVLVHGAVRRYRGWRGRPAAAGSTVSLRLEAYNGDLVASTTAKLGALGGFIGRMRVPAQVRHGSYYAKVLLGKQQLDSSAFRVAAYRPPRFYTRVFSRPRRRAAGKPPAKPYRPRLNGEPLRVRALARYFHGAALDGAAYRLRHRQRVGVRLSLREGFTVGLGAWGTTLARSPTKVESGVLDRRGDLARALATSASPWPVQHNVELSVRSPAYRRASHRTWETFYPSSRLPAVKTLPRRGKRRRFRVMVLTPGGKARSGRVEVTLHDWRRHRSRSYRRVVDFDKPLWRRRLAVSKRGAALSVPWPRATRRRLLYLRLATRDKSGHSAHTLIALWRPTTRSHARRPSADRIAQLEKRRDAALTIRLDKRRYRRGDVARVTIERRAMRGDARLFIERERTFRAIRLRFRRRGNRDVAQISLPVEAAYFPHVTLRAIALRGGRAGLRSPLGPYAVAQASLKLSDARHRLSVALSTAKKRYRPRETVTIRVRVSDADKRPRRAQVVLMAVDEAVLRLTGFSLPDPYYDLSHRPGASVSAADLRAHLVQLGVPVVHVDHKKPLFGHGAGYGAGSGRLGGRRARAPRVLAGRAAPPKRRQRARRNFVTSPWHAMIVTDARGRASASFRLPDNLTRFRIMAFAVDAERGAGTGSHAITVGQPLTTLAALPRFLRVGDRAFAGVVIGNDTTAAGGAQVSVEASGAIGVDGATQRSVKVAKGQSATVRFWLRAKRAGAGKLRFSVVLGGERDAVQRELTVKPPLLMEAAAVSGQTNTGVAQGIAALGALQRDRGGLTLTLSSTALTGVDAGLEQLIGYPYGCLEQKSSKLLALAAAASLSDRFSIKLPDDPKTLMRAGLRELIALQRHDGGFGYWPTSQQSHHWGTAYALLVLHRARDVAGVSLPAPAIERALGYLGALEISRQLDDRYAAAGIPTTLLALALHGRDVTDKALAAYAARRRMPLFARAQLLMALVASRARQQGKRDKKHANERGSKRADKRAAAIGQLTQELVNSIRFESNYAHVEERLDDGYKVLMHSDARSSAMVLQALLAARPEHPAIPRLVRWFLSGRKLASFRNTQEAAWALLALWDYARIKEKDVPDFEAGVWLGRRRVLRATFAGRKLAPQVSKLAMRTLQTIAGSQARRLTIGKRGRGTLYYTARLRYARKRLPDKPRRHGFAVSKRVLVLDKAGRPLAKQRPPRLGDTLAVILEVSAPDARRYVVVDDPLPAGIEAIDTTLRTSSSFGQSALPRVSSWSHRELRDDRVLFFADQMNARKLTFAYLAHVSSPGQFIAPPTKVEEMYTPEVFGHTAATRVRFANP